VDFGGKVGERPGGRAEDEKMSCDAAEGRRGRDTEAQRRRRHVKEIKENSSALVLDIQKTKRKY
jgi:hypothetical protein